jgi:hypothetical protein
MSAWATRNDFVIWYRAREAFDVAGRLVAKGEVLAKNDPDVSIVLKVRPDLLLVSTRRKET